MRASGGGGNGDELSARQAEGRAAATGVARDPPARARAWALSDAAETARAPPRRRRGSRATRKVEVSPPRRYREPGEAGAPRRSPFPPQARGGKRGPSPRAEGKEGAEPLRRGERPPAGRRLQPGAVRPGHACQGTVRAAEQRSHVPDREGAAPDFSPPSGVFFLRGEGYFWWLFLLFFFFFGVWLETSLTRSYFLKEEAVRNTQVSVTSGVCRHEGGKGGALGRCVGDTAEGAESWLWKEKRDGLRGGTPGAGGRVAVGFGVRASWAWLEPAADAAGKGARGAAAGPAPRWEAEGEGGVRDRARAKTRDIICKLLGVEVSRNIFCVSVQQY